MDQQAQSECLPNTLQMYAIKILKMYVCEKMENPIQKTISIEEVRANILTKFS